MLFSKMSRVAVVCAFSLVPFQAFAASEEKVAEFLTVTGFDVAIDGLPSSADNAPKILGLEKSDFGPGFDAAAERAFDLSVMRPKAVQMISENLTDEELDHAIAFYSTELGQRLVATENASHLDDDVSARQERGGLILAELEPEAQEERVDVLKVLAEASVTMEDSLKGQVGAQFRFLVAADYEDLYTLALPESMMYNLLLSTMLGMEGEILMDAVVSSAATYEDFSNEELATYTAALQKEDMQSVYEVMDNVYFELLGDGFEKLAREMAQLGVSEEL